jgi:hypothetical protein
MTILLSRRIGYSFFVRGGFGNPIFRRFLPEGSGGLGPGREMVIRSPVAPMKVPYVSMSKSMGIGYIIPLTPCQGFYLMRFILAHREMHLE